MKPAKLLIPTLAWCAASGLAAQHQDWRLQLLAEEGVALGDALPEVAGAVSEKRFLELVSLLSSENFATREGAQKEIQRMGLDAKPWLDGLKESGDPEVDFRIREIRGQLGGNGIWQRPALLNYALASLHREKQGVEPPRGTPILYSEIFRDDAPDIGKQYRDFTFDASPGLTGKVAKGTLILSGRGPIEGDQRLILPAGKLTGKDTFPDRFSIEVMLGGAPGGVSAYHIGVSVGKVRTLFHPGYDGGGFRFELIDTHESLTPNKDMGFTPATDSLAIMVIGVERLPNGDVELRPSVIPKGKEARKFSTRITVPAAQIGALGSISLDRSGRLGGDALFDNLVIEIPQQP
ncbi:hypothetical protein HZ994_14150 [Akkermansiaceae bacterium]|nr:hypothetical protein HZ994_14150 [Akkermansiaceae bacterium]